MSASSSSSSRSSLHSPPVPGVGDAAQLRRDLALPDLTDPANGRHAIQLVIGEISLALQQRWGIPVRVHRDHPVVTVEDNYDVLGFDRSSITRDARYTRYVDDRRLLRTHTSAMIPPALRQLAADREQGQGDPVDVVLLCPGVVYRRDSVDRLHTGTPHQLDVWRVATSPARPRLDESDLDDLVAAVVAATLPGAVHRTAPARHPYTEAGRQIDVRVPRGTGEEWVEIGECGLAHPDVLARCGLDPEVTSGLAMGVGLDRLVMLAKGIEDIRLLRSSDQRVVEQMKDLAPYRAVSACPAIVRDLSVAVDLDADDEELGDRVRSALGDEADKVEEVRILSQALLDDLPPVARERLGIRPGQKNVLVRVVLRRLDRALRREEANRLRDAIYSALHEGNDGGDESKVVTAPW